jgi:hypothetical protein
MCRHFCFLLVLGIAEKRKAKRKLNQNYAEWSIGVLQGTSEENTVIG